MDRTQLLQHFDTLAETPDAVVKLRTLVLELATRGGLVPQESNDEPAAEILRRIEQKRKKKHNDTPELLLTEFPLVLPNGWALARNRTLFSLRKGKMPKTLFTESKGLPYLDIAALEKGQFRRFTDDLNCPQVDENSLVIVCDGSRSGLVLEGKRGVLGSTISAIDFTELDKNFLKVLLQAAYEHLNANKKGAAIPHLDSAALLESVSAIPPLAEQRRIVVKVEELLALCDELEARQTAAREHRTRLVRSALDHLTTGVRPSPGAARSARTTISGDSNALRPHHPAAPEDGRTPDDFRRHGAFVLNAFADLTGAPEDVPALRQAILSLAVKGHLTEKKAADGNAADLLRTIAKHKEQLVKTMQLRAREIIARVEESPSISPGNWAWCRLAEVCLNITDGFHNTPKTTPSGVRYITAQHIRPNVIDFDNCFFVSEMDHQELVSKTKPRKGDILVVNIGAGSGTAAIINADFEFSFKNVAILNKYDAIDSTYLYYVLHESRPAIFAELTKGGAQPFLSLGVLRNIVVALPPLAEQQRIVAKVDELMRWCDALEARLTAAQTTATHLLDATLHQILTA